MTHLLKELDAEIEGEVRYDPYSRILYSVDASIYQIKPRGVVLPRSRGDVVKTVKFAARHGIPLVPRGAGTGIAGGCIGDGLIVDLGRFMNRILEINYREGYAIVEAGVVQDQLNAALADKGFRFGPDTSTGNRATIGGMFGNNSSGAHSLRYGKTIDNVLEADLILPTGEVIEFSELAAAELEARKQQDDAEGEIYRGIDRIRHDAEAEVLARFPKIQRRVSGYSLDEILDEYSINLAKLLCGAEGTFGITTQLKVRIMRSPHTAGLVIVHFADLVDGLGHIPDFLKHDPFSVELVDDVVIAMGKQSPSFNGELAWLRGEPNGFIAVEFDAEDEHDLDVKIARFTADCEKRGIGYELVPLRDARSIAEVWQLRKAGLGLVLARRSEDKAIAFLEDAAVPPERVGEFMGELRDYVRKAGKEAAFYGHAGVGLIHVRPMLNLGNDEDVELMVRMMEDFADILLGYGGAMSGEHGDGLIRSWLIERMFGPKLYQAFKDIKAVFDPNNLMNPGKIVDAPGPRRNIRAALKARKKVDIRTMFNFDSDGGFAFAAGMCNGNAACRQQTGSMCPSFQASNDEMHSTRARATALQSILYGENPQDGLASEGLYKVMELCLQCKGCQTECPSQVDVGRMKSEFLYHYQKKHGIPLRSKIFGNIDLISKLSAPIPALANFGMNLGISKFIFDKIGITQKRKAPPFARERFARWLKRRSGAKPGNGDKIALFVDTFSEFNYPEIARSALLVLEALGCDIQIAAYSCCGRPAISKGMLDQAKSKAAKIQNLYGPLVARGYRIVGLEPSCILTFKDEHPALAPGETADRIAAAAMTIEEYLNERLQAGTLDLDWDEKPRRILLHGHCHQKAQVGTSPALNVLNAIPQCTAEVIDSGCCGMAGTFGYETEHYEFSMRIGEQRLFPAIRGSSADTIIVASGLSCRSQIEHGTQRKGFHFIEAVAAAVKGIEV